MKPQTRQKPHAAGAVGKKAPGPNATPQPAFPPRRPAPRTAKTPRRAQSQSASSQATNSNSFPIVGIGASAGGLEAFTELLKHLPPDTGLGFVLVQHLDPQHESALAQLLARVTPMPVQEVTNNLRVEPNHVYVIPPNTGLGILQGVLKLHPRQHNRTPARSVDAFFEALAQDQRERAIGVVLSGTASDGTVGLEAIKAEGGITFAQDDSARYDSMPRSAVAAGCVDFVLNPEAIARELARIAKHPYVAGQPLEPPTAEEHRASGTAQEQAQAPLPSGGHGAPPTGAQAALSQAAVGTPKAAAEGFKKILLLLRNHSGVDFSLYKATTIQRRITRRVVLNKLGTVDEYATSLRGNSKELDALYSDLLISVTSFFRNAAVFEALKRKIFPRLLLQPRRESPLRIWVAGCSTGQEAYSLAIAYLEFCEHNARAPKLQVFATDLNEALLERARRGLYVKNLLQDVSPERLRSFFVDEEGGYRVSKSVRELCVFARQDLLSDPPFSRMDVVSCRNLLIYIQPDLQQKILSAFHYSLNPGGLLLLGASESIGQFTDLFEPVDKKLKLFTRKAGNTPGLRLPLSRAHPAGKRQSAPQPLPQAVVAPEPNAQREADRLTVGRFAPPGVLVNAELQILQFRGATGAYLQPPTGQASFHLLKMAREGLMLPLRAALKKAVRLNQPVRTENVRFNRDGTTCTVNLEVVPLKNLKERCYLVFFEDPASETSEPTRPHPGPSAAPRPPGRRVAELERELAETRDYLQSLQEQYEAANEELQSSNEEVTSANEELQSINEELETSKEELESSNEELTTVNEEMAHRNQELHRLNSDLNNLHASINTPILLLGRDLTIRRFTSQAEKLFNLLATDIGRPLGGIKHNLEFPGLERFIAESIDTVSVRERQLQDTAGNWYVLRVRPYLTLENQIDGAVLVLLDINALKQNEQHLRQTRDFAHAIIDSVPALLILEPDLRVRTANESFYQAFRVTPAQTEGRLVFELGNGQWNIPALRRLLEEILPRQRRLHDYEMTHEFEQLGRRTLLLSARQVDHLQTIILSFTDITERKQAEELVQQARNALAQHASELQQAVEERTASLRETVRELEAFSYSMVHDMRAPLRAMSGFAHLLHQQYGPRLDDAGREHLVRIFNAADRLDQLIQDVLNYNRVLRDEAPLIPIPLDQLLGELRATYPDWSRAEIQVVSPLPTVLGHKALLAQCFSNLVENALKFVAPGRQPCLRLWAEPRDGQVRLYFQDNGIGIAPEHRLRVFGMFERVHAASEYEGTGIGLTIVRRAVQRMGGQVGFDSAPGQGSTFWIELPRGDQP